MANQTIPTSSPRILRMRDLPSVVGLGTSTIYALIVEGNFPKPFLIIPGGRAKGWHQSDISDWVQARTGIQQAGGAK